MDKRAELLRRLLQKEIRPGQTIKPLARPTHAWPLRLPASASQRRLWFIDQMGAGAKAYYVSATLTFKGRLDSTVLRQALDALVERHESLRTTFVSVEGEPQQHIACAGTFELLHIDLGNVDEMRRRGLVDEQRVLERERRFDVSSGPLIRGRLLQLAEDEHLLLITVHHIISDAWSMGVLTRELGELYSAYRQGRAPALPAMSIQYADYVEWQRQHPQQLDAQLAYWVTGLAGLPPEIDLPLDRPRPSSPSHRGASVEVILDTRLTANLKALALRHDVTLYMVLCAAWAILLSRLSGQDDVVIGTQVANRQRPELEALIGVFVNTLVLRIGVSVQTRIDALLRHVKEVTLGAYDHQDVPFDRVVEALRPERALSRNPLFQAMFILQNTPRSELQLPQLLVTATDGMTGYATVDLLLLLEERGDVISGTMDYAVDLFERTTVERWQKCFIEVLRGMTENAAASVADLVILPHNERIEVIETFNATEAKYPSGKLLHELFAEQAARTPDAVALICDDQSLTYAELNDRAERLSRCLRRCGVVPDRLVAICMQRSPDMVVGLLGILKAGGAYLPLDPTHPKDRLAYMIEDASPSVLLTQERLLGDLPSTGAKVIAIDGVSDSATSDPAPEVADVTSRNLAYVIYTSGSTGAPKAVMIEHESVVNLLSSMATAPGIQPTAGLLAVTTLSFDIAALEIFLPLLHGAKVVLARRETVQDAHQLIRLMDSGGVTLMQATPALWQLLIDAGWRGSAHLIALCGGEALSADLAVKLTSLVRELWNVYGPTETTIWSCRHHVTTPSRTSAPVESIGKPVGNTSIYILDEFLRPVPIGVAGEIYIGGAGLARGYMKRPALTAEKFVPDPFSTHDGARMYKTGDLARWRADGTIGFLGRNDRQVKIRGFRIETGEVEACLRRHPAVKDAVVLALEVAAGERQLVAHIIADEADHEALLPRLRNSLREWLPEYMIPSAWSVLDQWPLTASGKVDRRALPVPASRNAKQREFVEPQTDVEATLASIWSQVLRVAAVGRHDDFFELGGHSLLVIRAVFRINEVLGLKLTGADIYKSPTVGSLATRIHAGESEDCFVDLSKEAVLDDAIRPIDGSFAEVPGAILLTGATGFVGRFLLIQLLQDTDATLYCLVRAKSPAEARRRLKETLVKWDLWRETFADRIVPVPGDLRAARLGMDEATYEHLAGTIDAVYHCATQMNHLETYSSSKAANVDSSKALARFATQRRPKLINFISTLDVFSAETGGADRRVNEHSSIDAERHRASQGYVASKWVSEKIFLLAAERGIACNIFRLGLIWADTALGRYDELQREHRLLQSCLASGYGIQDFRYDTPPTAVDYAVRAVVALAMRNPHGRGIFHISATEPMEEGIFERCNAVAGASLTLLPRYQWTGIIERLHAQGESLPIVPLIEHLFGLEEAEFCRREHEETRKPNFDCSRTQAALEHAGIAAPPIHDGLLRACVKRMMEQRASAVDDRLSA